MAKNNKFNDVKKIVCESVADIDTHLKAAGFDMFMRDKNSGTETLNKIRRNVKVLEGKTNYMIQELEKEKESMESHLQSKTKRARELEKDNECLRKKLKKVQQELDDVFPDTSDASFNLSQDTSISGSQEEKNAVPLSVAKEKNVPSEDDKRDLFSP